MLVSRRIKKEGGFTLIEILVVIAVISLLATIAVMQYQKFRVQTYDTAAKSDLRNAMGALESYFGKKEVYPATSTELLANGLNLSQNVSFIDYKIETIVDGGSTVYMQVQHSGSPNVWQASYPEDGTQIEPTSKPLNKRGKRLGQLK